MSKALIHGDSEVLSIGPNHFSCYCLLCMGNGRAIPSACLITTCGMRIIWIPLDAMHAQQCPLSLLLVD
jgi:hypothetical protein